MLEPLRAFCHIELNKVFLTIKEFGKETWKVRKDDFDFILTGARTICVGRYMYAFHEGNMVRVTKTSDLFEPNVIRSKIMKPLEQNLKGFSLC